MRNARDNVCIELNYHRFDLNEGLDPVPEHATEIMISHGSETPKRNVFLCDVCGFVPFYTTFPKVSLESVYLDLYTGRVPRA